MPPKKFVSVPSRLNNHQQQQKGGSSSNASTVNNKPPPSTSTKLRSKLAPQPPPQSTIRIVRSQSVGRTVKSSQVSNRLSPPKQSSPIANKRRQSTSLCISDSVASEIPVREVAREVATPLLPRRNLSLSNVSTNHALQRYARQLLSHVLLHNVVARNYKHHAANYLTLVEQKLEEIERMRNSIVQLRVAKSQWSDWLAKYSVIQQERSLIRRLQQSLSTSVAADSPTQSSLLSSLVMTGDSLLDRLPVAGLCQGGYTSSQLVATLDRVNAVGQKMTEASETEIDRLERLVNLTEEVANRIETTQQGNEQIEQLLASTASNVGHQLSMAVGRVESAMLEKKTSSDGGFI